ncbi:putative disease resistance RPP13-like protein 1 [Phragmites australis]|uniref:putative disease resistance RPP13-like protein 1 n=1 Tax=Phragmites australis TaxID=29695 RepID=UPI002D78CB8A|nr:putative disease resistance RPP13-like protein 1 [Phragmites australis]
MEGKTIFASHMPATASPSPRTTGVPPLPNEERVMMYSAKMDDMVIAETYKHVPFRSRKQRRLPRGGAGDATSLIEMESSKPENKTSIVIHGKSTRVYRTDVSSFKALVQQLTGNTSSSPIPRPENISDVTSAKTDDSAITNVNTCDQKGFSVAFSPLRNMEIEGGVRDTQEEIIGRVDNKHEEITGRVDNKYEGIFDRASDKHAIMELILSHDPGNKRFTTVCIVGAEGLGKTALASLVYCDDTMRRTFDARAWLCLSDACDYEGLLRSVVASLTGVSCRISEREGLEEVLEEELMGKTFLLVWANLHENNVDVCRHLLPLLSVGDKGSAVMVTTSSNMVAGHLGTAHTYNLKPFRHDVFLNMAKPDFVEYSPLKRIISKIISECSGFPIFAKVIRGILYSASTQVCLDDIVGRKLTEILSKPYSHLHHLLYLSYSCLHPNQKRRLLYCSMFPRDYTYNREKLLRLWMSQGFIVPEKEKHRHDNCNDAFDELLFRSFFDYSPSSELREQKYVMSELSSHLAWSASGNSGNKFFRAHDHELHCIPKDVHHLSVIPKHCDSEIYFSSFTELRDLSTFLLVCNSQFESSDSQFHIMDVKALGECFHNFKCLKTLDLSHTDMKELPESVGYITSLCFLGLNNTNIRRLPNSVCNLFNLQTLELQNSAYLVELPNDIKNLTSLCHLDASKEHGEIYVPPGIGQLTNLWTLTTFTVGGVSWDCKVSELAYLNSLKGCLHIRSLNNVKNAEDARGACLAAKKLKNLSLEWCKRGEDVESNDSIFVAEEVLEALEPHILLRELNIKGYYGLKFPSWIGNHSQSNLDSITLDNCYDCEKLPPLGVLPALRCLFIQNLRRVQLISYEFCATDNISHKSFPKLEILKLRDMYNLECWHDVMDGDFPSLRSLSIERCPKLKSIPCFQFISDISIMSCSKLNLPGLQSLQTLKVGDLRRRMSFSLSCELRSLLMLEVICCEHLCSVDGLSCLQSLKHLKFRTCPRLNFVQDEPLPDTLETVDIHSNCYALSKWRPNGFEELPDASEVYRKFVRRKCEGKRVDDAVMQGAMSHKP